MSSLQQANRSVSRLLNAWQLEPTVLPNIVFSSKSPGRPAATVPIPTNIPVPVKSLLSKQGIKELYSHQFEAWENISHNRNVVIVTGTASGKTLCYNLSVFARTITNPEIRSLYIFPTKALAQDQFSVIERWQKELAQDYRFSSGIYDGDTPSHARAEIRKNSRIILTNPDMLHTGILPHHTNWAVFFRQLKYIVIDEIHTYRGVFGSNVANLIRRLKRIIRFYGGNCQFILTSATIANPVEHASKLIEEDVFPITKDGSPAGEKYFLIYNPPVINPDLGLRAGVLQESNRLMNDFLAYHLTALQFVRTRRSVEMMLKYLSPGGHPVEGYRSGYLPLERRKIEEKLRVGELSAVVATNALELGIDIGSIVAVILSGYPGTIASTRQQIGRAGRRSGDSLAVLVASSDPIDQFLVRHPEYLIDQSPERALIDPDNLAILIKHIRCAAFELPFKIGDPFGNFNSAMLSELLQVLGETGDLHQAGDRFFWMADQYPAGLLSLRSSSPETIVLRTESETEGSRTVGTVDWASACWMVHPEAVYMHAGQSFMVEKLDLDTHSALLSVFDGDYFTQPQSETMVELVQIGQFEKTPADEKYFGDIKVTTRVKGFRKVRWYTNENLGEGLLDLPPSELITNGYWLALTDQTVAQLREQGLWNSEPNRYGPGWEKLRDIVRRRDRFICQACGIPENGKQHHVHHKTPFRTYTSIEEANRLDNLITLCPHCHQRAEVNLRIKSGLSGLGYVLHQLASFFLMCDQNDLGVLSDPNSVLAEGKPVVAIYDMVPAGIGLSKALYDTDQKILRDCLSLVKDCPCTSGCPSCVGPGGENGLGGKQETLAILEALTGDR